MTKLCKTCQKNKSETEFYPHPQTRDGLAHKCKSCISEYNKTHRLANLEYYRAYDRARDKLPYRIAQRRAYNASCM